MPFTNPILAGTILVPEAIQSPNYVPGVSGWSINRDGTAEFSDVDARGELTAYGNNGSYARLQGETATTTPGLALMPPTVGGYTATTPALVETAALPSGYMSVRMIGPEHPSQTHRPALVLSTDGEYSYALLSAQNIEAYGETLIRLPNGKRFTVIDENTGQTVFSVGKNVDVSGTFTANNIVTGNVNITPVPNTLTTVTWNYGRTLPTPVRVFASPNTSVPGSAVQECSVSGIGTSSCSVHLLRTNNTQTSVQLMAIGGMG